MSDSYVASYP